MALAEQEATGIRSIFEHVGAHVTLERGGADDDLMRFLAFYEDAGFDLIWVTGHGNYVAFAPDENGIGIAGVEDGEWTDATALIGRAPEHDHRRLLVLNICDGARPTGYANGLPRLSIAGLLASEYQAVVSHLWPVHFAPSLAFGLGLASGLGGGASFFAAYCDAVQRLPRANDVIADELDRIGMVEQGERVRRSDRDLRNPMNSFSAAFYE